MSCLSARASLGLRDHARVPFALQNSRSRGSGRPWRAACFYSPALDANKQRLHSFVTAQCIPLRRQQAHVDEDALAGNLFVDLIKCLFRDLQSGVIFLLEQPKELQYLEFPSLQSAGKMAVFTIAVVMVLIVFLATVDSGLSYIVASLLRRIK